jgi:hypothetical protein
VTTEVLRVRRLMGRKWVLWVCKTHSFVLDIQAGRERTSSSKIAHAFQPAKLLCCIDTRASNSSYHQRVGRSAYFQLEILVVYSKFPFLTAMRQSRTKAESREDWPHQIRKRPRPREQRKDSRETSNRLDDCSWATSGHVTTKTLVAFIVICLP